MTHQGSLRLRLRNTIQDPTNLGFFKNSLNLSLKSMRPHIPQFNLSRDKVANFARSNLEKLLQGKDIGSCYEDVIYMCQILRGICRTYLLRHRCRNTAKTAARDMRCTPYNQDAHHAVRVLFPYRSLAFVKINRPETILQ